MNKATLDEADTATLLSEQASHWWVVLNSESASSSDRREFGEWIARSPERVAAYLRTVALMRALKSSELRWPDVGAGELIREAKATAPEPLPFPPESARVPTRRSAGANNGMLFLSGIAAALTVATVTVWLLLAGPQRYQTALGEQRSLLLDDGSRITLNTASKIEVDLREDHRLIRLIRGEALFEVAHDAARPFDVETGAATFRAVGTQFNVDRRPASTTVAVVEGKVAVLPHLIGKGARPLDADMKERNASPAAAVSENISTGGQPIILVAAQRLTVTDSRLGTPEAIVNLAAATAWTQRRLIFEHRPLVEVAAEFNRYNRETIRIEDAELQRQQVTGMFQANDPDSFLTFLAQIPGVRVLEAVDGSTVVTTVDGPSAHTTSTN